MHAPVRFLFYFAAGVVLVASRDETSSRKSSLLADMRKMYEAGSHAGSPAPSVRELSASYNLSLSTISIALKELVEMGVLYTVPRVGTFIGRPPAQTTEPYLFVLPFAGVYEGLHEQMRIGFEDRIALLGGACLSLPKGEALSYIQQDGNLRLSGVFETDFTIIGETLTQALVPCVVFHRPATAETLVDSVNFDNEEGGAQVARHLLGMGHRRIAFLGLHNLQNEDRLRWSRQRQAGWRSVMVQANQKTDDLVFCPQNLELVRATDHAEAGRQLGHAIVQRPDITAIVAVNVYLAQGVMEALKESGLPGARWPAIVCFDYAPDSGASMVSYVRLPWERIGSEAARLLWERKNGRVSAASQQRLVSMQLIPRLTCRSDWGKLPTLSRPLSTGLRSPQAPPAEGKISAFAAQGVLV